MRKMHPVQAPAPRNLVFSLLPRARVVAPRSRPLLPPPPALPPWGAEASLCAPKTHAEIDRQFGLLFVLIYDASGLLLGLILVTFPSKSALGTRKHDFHEFDALCK